MAGESSPAQTARELYPAYLSLLTSLLESLEALVPRDEDGRASAPVSGSSAPQQPSTQQQQDVDQRQDQQPQQEHLQHEPVLTLQRLMAVDTQLQALEGRVRSHQSLVQQVQQVRDQLNHQNRSLLSHVKALYRAQDSLESVLSDAHDRLRTMRQANQGSIEYKELLSYAQRVSKHTMSPVNANTWVVEPPIPQDNHMRMSLLFRQGTVLATAAGGLQRAPGAADGLGGSGVPGVGVGAGGDLLGGLAGAETDLASAMELDLLVGGGAAPGGGLGAEAGGAPGAALTAESLLDLDFD
ncbi:vitamin-D-receptor interacting mediator subunit 4-domain-containing protein [Entophlyctis helioformis]|nr:vitamin-D-receptor interacting mediator subunit 4-domain-containing protein [Entophlyctis helioformis]